MAISDTMIFVVIIFLLLFLLASGAVFIHYGNKIKNGKISSDDKQAGEFIFSFGIIGLIVNIISLIMFGYKYRYFEKKTTLQTNSLWLILFLCAILFTTAGNILLIIYGLKMHQNNICPDIQCPYSKCIDDFRIANFIVAFGSICIIFSLLAIIYNIYNKFSKSKSQESPESMKEEE